MRGLQQTEGIVFRLVRFKESSLIADIFTLKFGLQSFLLNGVYKKGDSRLASAMQLMHIVDLICYYHEAKTLHRIKELRESFLYRNIPFDIHRSAIASFILEVSRKAIKDAGQHESLYHFLRNTFAALDEQEILDHNFHIGFLFNFSAQLGFECMNNYSDKENSFDIANGKFIEYDANNSLCVNPITSRHMHTFLANASPVDIKTAERREVLHHLLTYYRYHIEQFGQVKSIDVFQSIL